MRDFEPISDNGDADENKLTSELFREKPRERVVMFITALPGVLFDDRADRELRVFSDATTELVLLK